MGMIETSDLLPATLPAQPIRQEICLNGEWGFHCETDAEPTTIRVPGSYSIMREGKWARFYWDAFGYPERWTEKGATYRRTFTVPAAMAGKRLRFCCDGCSYHTRVYLNGQQVGESHDGYYPFECELNPALQEGENVLEVVVEARGGDTLGAESMANRGIWKNTWLRAYPELAVEYGAYVVTSVREQMLTCHVPVRNQGAEARTFFIRNVVTDSEGQVVKVVDGGRQTLAAGERAAYTCADVWTDARCWFPHDPYLYHLHTVLYDEAGNPVDWHTLRFGFREITVDGPHLYLNGRELFLRGHGGHYCGDLQGARAYAEQWIRSLQALGVNFMRLHVYPRHKELYEVADELGFMLEAEGAFHFRAPDDERVWKDHFDRMVADQRNHPSVILWSASNEFRWHGGGEHPEMVEYLRSLDPTRPVFASDFSGWSLSGDVISHHYNADTVFEEWEEFGPNKPMIWDELGNVWQPNRPLRNGTAGYEVTCQDYATGLWRDGHDDMLGDILKMADGKVFAGELHRVNGFIPWDLSYCFFRFLPTNKHRTLPLTWPTLEGPGIKQRFIQSCASTINIWDDELPVCEPNPGLYFFEKYLRAVRFFDQQQTCTYYGGTTAERSGKLYYEDLRFADTLACRVETRDGRCLWEEREPCALVPGQLVEMQQASFAIPAVTEVTPAYLVRQFSCQGEAGYRDEVPVKLFPRFQASQVPTLGGLGVGVVDPAGELSASLRHAGVSCSEFAGVAEATAAGIDLLIVAGEAAEGLDEFIAAGGRALWLRTGDVPADGPAPSARIPLHGPTHRLLADLGQEGLTHWRGGAVAGTLPWPDGPVNARVVLAGDKDGGTAALYECFRGEGVAVVTSLRLAASLGEEPAADCLLRNALRYLASYRTAERTTTAGVLAGSALRAYLRNLGLAMDVLPVNALPSFASYRTLIVDAGDPSIVAGLRESRVADALHAFAAGGGQVFVYGVGPDTVELFAGMTGKPLAVTEPFLLERHHCVKAAVSWTQRDTPAELVEYYDGVLIPQPFEPNYDPLLAGISNRDLYWNGEAMFGQGIEITGMDPVTASEEYAILVSNWRIDWSQPKYGGEYIQEAKDIRRADWFINRDPVVFRVAQGAGSWVFCQLDLCGAGGEAGRRVARQLLTNLGCALGEATRFAADDVTFDLSPRAVQLRRFSESSANEPARRVKYGLGSGDTDAAGDGVALPKVLLIGDSTAQGYSQAVAAELEGWAQVTGARPAAPGSIMTSRELVKNIYSFLNGARWDIIHVNIGLEDVKRFARVGDGERPYLDSDALPVISLEEFRKNVREIITVLKMTGARLYWNLMPPLPEQAKGFRTGDAVEYNQAVREIMTANGVYMVDLYQYVRTSVPEYACGDTIAFTPEQLTLLARQIAAAIRYFGE